MGKIPFLALKKRKKWEKKRKKWEKLFTKSALAFNQGTFFAKFLFSYFFPFLKKKKRKNSKTGSSQKLYK